MNKKFILAGFAAVVFGTGYTLGAINNSDKPIKNYGAYFWYNCINQNPGQQKTNLGSKTLTPADVAEFPLEPKVLDSDSVEKMKNFLNQVNDKNTRDDGVKSVRIVENRLKNGKVEKNVWVAGFVPERILSKAEKGRYDTLINITQEQCNGLDDPIR